MSLPKKFIESVVKAVPGVTRKDANSLLQTLLSKNSLKPDSEAGAEVNRLVGVFNEAIEAGKKDPSINQKEYEEFVRKQMVSVVSNYISDGRVEGEEPKTSVKTSEDSVVALDPSSKSRGEHLE